MFIERDVHGKLQLTYVFKLVTSIIATVSIVAGSLFFIADRYFAPDLVDVLPVINTENQDIKHQILETKQKVFEKELESIELKYNLEKLESLIAHRLILKKALDGELDNELLQKELESISQKIDKLENEIYGE